MKLWRNAGKLVLIRSQNDWKNFVLIVYNIEVTAMCVVAVVIDWRN